MPEGRDPRNLGEGLLEQLQALRDQLGAEVRQPGDVPTRPRETGHEPVSDRIANDRHDDGDRGGRLLYSTGRWRIRREDEVDLETGQFGRQTWEPLDLPIGRSVLNEDVLTLHIAAFAQALPESVERHPRLGRFKRTGHQVTDPWDLRRGLYLGDDRGDEDADGERGCERRPQDHHAATDVCWLSTAAIFRQPSIPSNLIGPLAVPAQNRLALAGWLMPPEGA